MTGREDCLLPRTMKTLLLFLGDNIHGNTSDMKVLATKPPGTIGWYIPATDTGKTLLGPVGNSVIDHPVKFSGLEFDWFRHPV